jgi:hypothetical protein
VWVIFRKSGPNRITQKRDKVDAGLPSA